MAILFAAAVDCAGHLFCGAARPIRKAFMGGCRLFAGIDRMGTLFALVGQLFCGAPSRNVSGAAWYPQCGVVLHVWLQREVSGGFCYWYADWPRLYFSA